MARSAVVEVEAALLSCQKIGMRFVFFPRVRVHPATLEGDGARERGDDPTSCERGATIVSSPRPASILGSVLVLASAQGASASPPPLAGPAAAATVAEAREKAVRPSGPARCALAIAR